MTDSDRAVSEVVGFTLVFALVVSMVALVTVVGFADLEDVRSFEQSNNAERAFDVVADNVGDVLLRGAPSRATELELTDASVYTDDRITINVTASGSAPPLIGNATYRPRPIVYEGTSDTQIVYVAGAVFRSQREGGRVVKEPPFVLQDDRIFLPVAVTQSQGQDSIGGSTVRLRTIATDRSLDVLRENTPYNSITINVTSPRFRLWADYFRSEPTASCTVKPDVSSVECDLTGTTDPKRVTIQSVRISVEFVE